ncbi:hypothetical protein niasHT_034218 [Heterodera trifolii]|uniref:Uncharacterized protein n=1 Tax=Heterodera trifolii TaxID=157864 RepID=A0ABD2J5C8_9BILA
MSNQTAAQLADEYERGDGEVIKSNQGKRTKSEQVEHKHGHPEGDTRRIVDNAVKGEEKRKEKERTTSQSSK